MADSLTDIAIIGMAGRFPGARDIRTFWRNLCEGRESISSFTVEELVDEAARELARQPNYVGARAIIEDADEFDASFFGIYPREAELIDPQQRIFLECCWHAFEDAGYDPLKYDGVAGVFAGCSPNSYFLKQICGDANFPGKYSAGYQVSDFVTTLGTNSDFLATRVAYKLNLKGHAFSINCGCSTSLVAISQACLSLQNYQIDMALAGGVSITFPQKRGYLHEAGGMVSPDGHCRTFDAEAQGTVFGDGAAVVLLKRLEDALADRDHIYALIKGFGITNDGSAKVGFTAPGVEGQARAIVMAHAAAGVEPRSISYIEAHGTGTPLGDPIEIAALTQAFRRQTQERGFCAIGTAKTNIGHLDIAAGVTGLIKTALSLDHKTLPPMLHFRQPNPALDLENSPFRVNTILTPWQRGDTPLRAGVSAFGIGGTNAHIVMEEAPEAARVATKRSAHLIVLSAKTPKALEAITENLVAHIAAGPEHEIADIAHTLMVGRHSFSERRYAVVHDSSEAGAILLNRDPARVLTGSSKEQQLEIAFMFPGQGSQYVGMGGHLYASDAGFRSDMDESMSILKSTVGLDLGPVIYPADKVSSAHIDDTAFAQPAIFAIEYALARLWMRLGIRPAAMIGHSVGEFVAACLAGVFSLDQAVRLIAERGRLMQTLPRGAMLAIGLGEAKVSSILEEGLSIAALNGPSLTVVAGPESAVTRLEHRLSKERIVFRRLRTSHAFHSSMMDPVREPFAELVRGVTLSAPNIPFISSVTGTWIGDTEATSPEYWANHLREPVRFASGVKELRAIGYALLEVGPGRALSVLARQQPAKSPDQLVLASIPESSTEQTEEEAILNALGNLWLNGAEPDWSAVYVGEKRRRVPLIGYPFERKRCWIDTSKPNFQAGARALPSFHSSQTSTTVDMTVQGSPIEAQSSRETVALPLDWEVGVTGPMESASLLNREARIRVLLESIFQDLSGIDLSAASVSTTFLELGFDSLFLTQVSQALQSKFNIKITFRQLLDQLSTLDSLSAHIDQHLAPDVLQDAIPSPVVVQPNHSEASPSNHSVAEIASSSSPPSRNGLAGATSLEALMKAQLQTMSDLMSKQLETFRSPANGTPATQIDSVRTHLNSHTPQVSATSPLSFPPAPTNGNGPQPRKFLPFRPVEAISSELGPVQQQHLRALVDRYTRKTAGSKRFTEQHRDRLADPRVAAGFRMEWKELVYPIVAHRSKGSKLWDVDGNEYIDMVNGYGPIMFGHAPEFVSKAIRDQLESGYETGPQSPLAGEVTDLICEMTGMDRITFCNTGSEAVVAALRVARTITGRSKVVLFTGAYHGMFDEVVVRGVPGPDGPRSLPVAPGIPREHVENVVVLDYGTPEALSYIESHAAELAAVLVEPVQSRHPALRPIEFLQNIRRITEQSGTALIFDEVVTGFRVHKGGCQAVFGIKADLATYGKVLGGGLPIGILAGRAAFMDALDGGRWTYGDASFPEVGVTFFAGTFVRHPLALAATLSVLRHLQASGPTLQDRLAERTSRMAEDMNAFLKTRQVPTHVDSYSSFAHFTFPVDLKYSGLLYYYMRERGIHIQEGFPMFLTTAHSDEDLAKVVRAFKESIIEMEAAGFLPAPTSSTNADNRSETAPLEEHIIPVAPATTDESPVIRRAPVTESQLEILLSARISDEASCAYNESFTLKLSGELDSEALGSALNTVIARHDGLRASFNEDNQYQEFADAFALDFRFEDLSRVGEVASHDRFDEIRKEEARVPFDLNHGPMVRARLVKTGDREHHLLFTSHHAVCDGWSTNVILDELSTSYSAFREGVTAHLQQAISFGQYAEAQVRHFASPQGTLIENYWLDQFKQAVPLLDLPLDRPRPAVRANRGGTRRRQVSADVYRALKKTSAHHKCTLFATLLAGFQVLLSRLSGQNDIVVGIPTAGQSAMEGVTLVGHCVNFLPVRGNLEKEPSFSEFMTQIKRTLLDAYENQNYTYGRLIRKLGIRRDPSRLPLLEVQFNLERVGTGMNFSDLDVTVDPSAKAFVNQDIFLNIVESENGLVLYCDYNTGLFDAATIDRWLGHYQTLLESVTEDARQSTLRIPLLSQAEMKNITTEWNDTQMDYPKALCVHHLFEDQGRQTPDAIAAVFKDEQITYGELEKRANQMARYLHSLGVAPGSVVAIVVDRSVKMLVALLGVMKAGCAYVPLDAIYPKERIGFILQETKSSVVITEKTLESCLSAWQGLRVYLDVDWSQIALQDHSAPGINSSSDDLAYVIYTSGSTGRPKGVEITHRAFVNLLKAMSAQPGLKQSDVLLAVTTLSFDIAGLELMLPLTVGARVVIASRETAADGASLLTEIKRTGANVLQATPITWRQLLDAGWSGQPPLKMLCGGEALPTDLADRLVSTGSELWNMYGPTETTIWSSTSLINDAGKITIGKPIANTQMYVLDQYLQPVPIGVTGELHIGGDGLARGYFMRPELTAEKFIPNPMRQMTDERLFKTGDLARYLKNGTIQCLGRRDGQIKLRGYRIELGEIEAILAENEAVQEAAVSVDRDDSGEPRLVAYTVAKPEHKLDEAQLRVLLRNRLPEYMVPSAFVSLECMPRTANGKLDRNSLPKPASTKVYSDSEKAGPNSADERLLCGIWAEVLGLSSVGIYDDVFALGADSLDIFKIATRARKAGLPVLALQIFEQRTVAELARHARATAPDTSPNGSSNRILSGLNGRP